MKLLKQVTPIFIFLLIVLSPKLFAINTEDTRMLSQPAISSKHIAFIYAEDLWIANIDGTSPKRLTIDEGIESRPVFSQDGKHIAFSAQYDGNTDVFLISSEGGIPKRLTWHPGTDLVLGFTPDGENVLFSSQRSVFTNRYSQLFTVSLQGNFPAKLKIPNAFRASYSPDGKFMAYTPIAGRYQQWKHYRGGTVANIWLFSFQDHSIVKIPQPDGGCNDTEPMWIGSKIFFRSDRNGEFNLYSYDVSSKNIVQHTDYTDFPIINASSGNSKIIFEQAGYLHTLDIGSSEAEKLKVGIATDLLELRARFVKGGSYIRSAGISPTGVRAVFDFRGDIMTVPAEKGDARNLTQTTSAHEKYPQWSPDGKNIAYFSDASGEYELHIKSQDGKTNSKVFPLTGTGFYAFPEWSPDSKKICFVDNGRNIYFLNVESGTIKKIDADEMYVPGSIRDIFGDWSFDSKWISYTKITNTNFSRVYLYSVEKGISHEITDGMSNSTSPVFDPDGKYLFFLASTDAGPVVNWFDQSNIDMRMRNSIYLATLQKETLSPFSKESDEEEAEEGSGENEKPEGSDKKEKR